MLKNSTIERPDPIVTPVPSVMGTWDSIYKSSYKFPQFTNDQLISQKGWDTADTMLKMAACRAPFNLKRYSVMGSEWRITPAIKNPNDPKADLAQEYCDMIAWMFDNILTDAGLPVDPRSIIFEVLRGQWDGFRVAEIQYRYLEDGPFAGKLGLAGVNPKHSKQIGFTIDDNTAAPVAITSYVPGGGYGTGNVNQASYDFNIPVERCIVYTYNPDANLPFGDGDWRACYKDWFALDYLLRIRLQALEVWGAPMLLGFGSANALAGISEALAKIHSGGKTAFQDGTRIEALSAPTGVWDGFNEAIMWHENSIAKNVLGNILSMGEGGHGATSAGAGIHQETGDIFVHYARLDIETIFRHQLINRLCEINIPNYDSSLCPLLSLGGTRYDNMLAKAQSIDLLVKDGIISPTAPFIRADVFGMPALTQQEADDIAAAKQAEQDAATMLASAKATNSGVAKMSSYEDEKALQLLKDVLISKNEVVV